jgi:hypothetical protein
MVHGWPYSGSWVEIRVHSISGRTRVLVIGLGRAIIYVKQNA